MENNDETKSKLVMMTLENTHLQCNNVMCEFYRAGKKNAHTLTYKNAFILCVNTNMNT